MQKNPNQYNKFYIRSAHYKNKYLRSQLPIEDEEKRNLLKNILSHENLLCESYEERDSIMIDTRTNSILFPERLIQLVLKKNGFDYILFNDEKIYDQHKSMDNKIFFAKNVNLPPDLFFKQMPLYISAFIEKDPKIKKELIEKIKTSISDEELKLAKETYKEEKRIKKEEAKKRFIENFNLDIKTKKTEEIFYIYNNKTIFSFDIEAYEKDNSLILEIGFSKFRKGEHIETQHLIIKEHLNIYNGNFVEDNKHNFLLGKSKIVSLEESLSILINELNNKENIIVGVGVRNDFKFIKSHLLLQEINKEKRLIDCGYFSPLYQKENTMGVKSFLKHFNIEHKYLHNAGNDAYYTALIFNEIHHSLQLRKDLENKINPEENNQTSTIHKKIKNSI